MTREVIEMLIAATLAASGIAITCAVRLLLLVRDWKTTQRAVRTRAEADEAVRDYYRELAKQANVRTAILAWTFRQTKKGQASNEVLLQMVQAIQSGRMEPAMSAPQTVDLPVNFELPIDAIHAGPFTKAS